MDLKKRRQFNEKLYERLLARRSHEAGDIRRFKDELEKQFQDTVKNKIAEPAPGALHFLSLPMRSWRWTRERDQSLRSA
jgi:hypothetical protein